MQRLASVALSVFFCFSLIVATAQQAHAYVDPGAGLLALQSAASVAAAGAYFLRRRIRSLFTRSAVQDDQAPAVAAKQSSPIKAA
jgi:hypothetical protein